MSHRVRCPGEKIRGFPSLMYVKNTVNCSVTFSGNVESDAIRVTVSTDPPGQACRYIPPGDTSSEMYRLSTFRHAPIELRKTRHLAKIGFFYTGFKDRIKCFSCGQYIEALTGDEDFMTAGWHNNGCLIPGGGDPSNQPMLECANNSAVRSRSSHVSVRVSTQQLQPTMPLLQTASYVFPRQTTHRQTSPSGVQTTPSNNAPSGVISNQQSSDFLQLFPCRQAISPHMARAEARLETFTSQMARWSSNNTIASPLDMADAGLFYIGDRDRVKCWYCNGGLQNWLPQDNPWYEHAKWFPTCEFVLQQKGPDYVHRICERFPNLQRPVVPTAINHTSGNVVSGLSTATFEPPQIIDGREEMRRRNRRVDTEMESSTLVVQAKELGFGDGQIRTAITKCVETNDRLCTGFEELLDLILEYGDQNQVGVSEHCSEIIQQNECETNSDELNRLVKERRCRVCLMEVSSIVLRPCYHLVLCNTCSGQAQNCPMCRTAITEKIVAYLS